MMSTFRSACVPVAGLALVLLSSCGGSDGGQRAAQQPAAPSAVSTSPPTTAATTATGQPRTEAAARAAATGAFTAYAAGDYESSWDYFAKADRVISRTDYARVLRECRPSGSGLVPTISAVRPEGASYVVTVTLAGVAASRTMVYEDGQWRMRATAETKAAWSKGADSWLTSLRSQGSCG